MPVNNILFFKKLINSATSLPLASLIVSAYNQGKLNGDLDERFGSESGAIVFYFFSFCVANSIITYLEHKLVDKITRPNLPAP